MWMPPDLGRQYARELERKQLEEAHHREGQTGRPSYLLRPFRLGLGQKLLLLGIVLVVALVLLAIAESLSSPLPPVKIECLTSRVEAVGFHEPRISTGSLRLGISEKAPPRGHAQAVE